MARTFTRCLLLIVNCVCITKALCMFARTCARQLPIAILMLRGLVGIQVTLHLPLLSLLVCCKALLQSFYTRRLTAHDFFFFFGLNHTENSATTAKATRVLQVVQSSMHNTGTGTFFRVELFFFISLKETSTLVPSVNLHKVKKLSSNQHHQSLVRVLKNMRTETFHAIVELRGLAGTRVNYALEPQCQGWISIIWLSNKLLLVIQITKSCWQIRKDG